MDDFIQRLRERKLVQWALAYVAAAFALIQVSDVVAQQFDWGDSVRRGITMALAVGFLVTLVLAWYHGERGAQRVGGTELLIIALLLAIGGAAVWRFAPRAAESAAVRTKAAEPIAAYRKSIAVLPFANLSSDKENDYFADGMRDMILTKLAAIGDLKVISRTSTDKYANKPDDLKTVALQLGVASVLEGSVQKSGNQVLINLQLISASDDQHLWAEAYKRTVDDIFGVEGEVAQTVAEALNAKLSVAEQKVVAEKPTTNPVAFDLFLRAEQARHSGERSLEHSAINDAAALYERAVANDPKFALAWAGMSISRSWLYFMGATEVLPVQEAARLALENAQRALDLQPTLAEANVAMGFYHYYVRVDLAHALVSFQTALRTKPNDVSALGALGLVTRRLARFDEAIDYLKAAKRIDPRNRNTVATLMSTLVQARHYSAMEEICKNELVVDPEFAEAWDYCAWAQVLLRDDVEGSLNYLQSASPLIQRQRADYLRWLKRYKEAIELIEAMPDTPENFRGEEEAKSHILGVLYLESGQPDVARPLLLDARAKLAEASAAVPDDHPGAAGYRVDLAYVDALLGNTGAALDLANNALELPATQPEKNYLGWQDVAVGAARVYARLHRADLAVPLLEKLLASPGPGYVVPYADLRLAPEFEPIRNDPTFQALLKSHPGSGDVPE